MGLSVNGIREMKLSVSRKCDSFGIETANETGGSSLAGAWFSPQSWYQQIELKNPVCVSHVLLEGEETLFLYIYI